jgi:hypothetical protein
MLVEVIDRKRMKAAKSWRILFLLPTGNQLLPSVLSGMIDNQVRCRIVAKDGLLIEVDPVIIEDVTTTKAMVKQFILVIETCYEYQAKQIATHLTSIVGEAVTLSLYKSNPSPVTAQGVEPPSTPVDIKRIGDISKKTLKGLHCSFFYNTLFFSFVEGRYNALHEPVAVKIETADTCKLVFKEVMGVASCSDLKEEDVLRFISEFNQWLKNKG